ncbi:hypothetical protein GCM10009616_22320 [Microlunatus lacustris]
MSSRRRVLVVAGYFDWFSGYQETVLVPALAKHADVEVMASDRVSPAFQDSHLAALGLKRRYGTGTRWENNILVARHASFEKRSMVWSTTVRKAIDSGTYDLIVQVMPGQLLSSAPAFTCNPAPRVALYGDNKAMWSHLPRWKRIAKGGAFAVSKGLLYTVVNRRSEAIYGYTPDTIRRLRPFQAGRPAHLLPLAFSAETFHPDDAVRHLYRTELGLSEDDVLLLAAGKIQPQKRLEWLQESFEQLAVDHPRVHLLLVGADSSDYSERIQQAFRTSVFRDRMYVRPFTNGAGLNAAFNGADLGVWPRNPAITIQQALGTGLSVLLPRNDLVGHLVRKDSGHYFELREGEEVERLAEALKRALAQTDFSQAARRTRATNNRWLSADSVARQLLAGTGTP